MNTLHLFFVGLIAFVPNPDGSKIDVLLVDARNEECVGGQGPSCEGGCVSPAHKAMLAVRKEDVAGPCPGEERGFCVWSLDGIEVQIKGLDQALERRQGRGRNMRTLGLTADRLPENAEDAVDFTWLADMNAVVPGGGHIKSTIGLREPNASATAQIIVDQGRLGVCNLVQYEGNPPRVPLFEFRPLGTGADRRPYRQALADEVELNARMAGRRMQLYLTGADGRVTVINLDANNDRAAEVLVLNVPRIHSDSPRECDDVGADFYRFFPWAKGADQVYLPHRTPEFRSGDQVQPGDQEGCYDRAVRDFLLGEHGYFIEAAEQHCSQLEKDDEKNKCVEKIRDVKSVHTRPICPMAVFER